MWGTLKGASHALQEKGAWLTEKKSSSVCVEEEGRDIPVWYSHSLGFVWSPPGAVKIEHQELSLHEGLSTS